MNMDPNKDVDVLPSTKPINNAPKKKKKKHVFLKVLLTIFIFFFVLPIATIYICFYDGTRSNVKKAENFDINNVMTNAAIDSLDNVKDTHQIELKISTDDFNQILLNTYENSIGSNATISQYVTSLYVEATDTNYNFYADINVVNMLKSRLKIETSFKEGKVDGKDAYIFNINDIKLGKIGGLLNLAKKYASNVLNDEFLQSIFNGFGLSFVSDVANNRLYYLLENVPDDITKFLASGGDDLFGTALYELFGGEYFTLSFTKDGLSAKIDLENLGKNAEFVDKEKEINVEWGDYKETLASWLSDGIVSASEVSNAMTYLVKGADASSTYGGDSSPLKGKDLTSYKISISDYKTYKGIYSVVSKPEVDLKQYVQNQINIADIFRCKIASIDEKTLNQTLQTSGTIGTNYILQRQLDDGSYKVSPMMVTNMYANVYETGLKIVIEFNVNEYPLYICVDALYEGFDATTYSLSFDIDNIYFGEDEATDDFKESVYSIISDSFASDNTFSFDKENHKLIAKFDVSIADSGNQDDIDITGTPTITLTGEKMSDNGTIEIGINPSVTIKEVDAFPKADIVEYFGTLGETYKDDIIAFTSKNGKYRKSQVTKTVDEKSYEAFVVDCDDLDYDFANPEKRPMLEGYLETLRDAGFTIGDVKDGINYTMCYKIYEDGLPKTTGTIVSVGLLQIDDYFQAFYAIKYGDITEYISIPSIPTDSIPTDTSTIVMSTT